MSLRDILSEVTQNCKKPISDNDFKRYYNRCVSALESLYDTAKKYQEYPISCQDINAYYPLPDNCVGVKKVKTSKGYNFSVYEVQNNSIRFLWKDDYIVHIQVLNTPITNIEGNITIHPAYLSAIPVYIEAQIYKSEDDKKYNDLMSEFTELAALANNNIRKVNNPCKQIRTRPFR